MVIKDKDQRRTETANLRGGDGTVYFKHFFEKEDTQGAGKLFAVGTLPPGTSIKPHTHEGENEIYLILEGTAHAEDNGVPVVLEAGDTIACLNGGNHAIENRGDKDLKILFLLLNPNPQAQA